MNVIEKVLIAMLVLVGLYLFLANANATNKIFTSLGSVGIATFGTLQGRNVRGLGGVEVSSPIGVGF
jgi:multisubunit Na+/H+ antiporter MnhC subunit